jgi:subtilisin family serine protease
VKPHLTIKYHQQPTIKGVPHWVDFINDKTSIVEEFGNDVDKILKEAGLKVWITTEYHLTGDSMESQEGLNRIYRIIFQQDGPVPQGVLESLRKLPQVEYVRIATIGKAELPDFGISASYGGQFDNSRKQIYLPEAHLRSKGSKAIKIAILDTGVDWDHDELKGVVEKRKDFVHIDNLDTTDFIGDITGYDDVPEDEVGHGTHVAGIIAGKGIKIPPGVAPECKIYAVRVLATLQQGNKRIGAGLIDNINVGIKWAVDSGADIINMSLGVKHEHGGLPHEEVVRYAMKKGVTIVAASGNDGTSQRYYPGALPGVLAISAVDGANVVAGFSTFGDHVSLSAPGVNIMSSFLNNTYMSSSGTSQAAPFVTGTIALLKSFAYERKRKLSDAQIKYILKHTSDKKTTRYKDRKLGYGVVNTIDAIRLLDELISN